MGVDGGVHADDFAVHVEQRSAGVAGVDGGVSLNEVLELAACAGLDGAIFSGDDSGGDGLGEGEGTADGLDPIADVGGVRVADFDGRERDLGIDFDDGDVSGFIKTDDDGGSAFIVIVTIRGELDVDFVGLLDDVIVGDDVALGVNDEAGAEGLPDALLIVLTVAEAGHAVGCLAVLTTEEVIKEVLHAALAALLALLVVVILTIAGVLGDGSDAAVHVGFLFVAALLGEGGGVDVDDGWASGLGDADKLIGWNGGVCDFQRCGIARGDLLVFTATDAMRGEGADDDGDGESGEEDKDRSETAGAQSFHQCFHFSSTS